MLGVGDKKEIRGLVNWLYPIFKRRHVVDLILSLGVLACGISLMSDTLQGDFTVWSVSKLIFLALVVLLSTGSTVSGITARVRKNRGVNLINIYGDPLHPIYFLYNIPEGDTKLARMLVNFDLRQITNELKKVVEVDETVLSPYTFIRIREKSSPILDFVDKIAKTLRGEHGNHIDLLWREDNQELVIEFLKVEIINMILCDSYIDLSPEQKQAIYKIKGMV